VDVPTELFINQPLAGAEALETLLPLSDYVLLDSKEFEDSLDTLNRISRAKLKYFDFQWIRLAPWRDQIRQVFDRAQVGERLNELRSIEVHSSASRNVSIDFGGMLIAAWLAERLGAEPVAYGSFGYECVRGTGEIVRIGVMVDERHSESRLGRIEFRFDGGTVRLMRNEGLECVVELGHSYRFARPFEDEELQSIIKRYYLIGESISNYDGALRSALDMIRLRQGFTVM
jgi:glucose-6-phosphate dehydrogenase assembly protein OpcA